MIRNDFWQWSIKVFGKEQLKLLLSEHQLKDGLFLNGEEQSYVYKILAK